MKKENRIRLGIVGMGRMGITHFSIINTHPEVEIVAIADTSPFILSMIGKYLPDVKTYKDYSTMLSEVRPEAILVCTPPNLNFAILSNAAEKGVHAFVEKPFTTNSGEGRRLADMFAEKNLVNQVGYVNRFNDVFMKMKQLVSEGTIGRIIRFKSEMFSCTITNSDEGSGWRASRESGGGAIYEMATHAIDLVVYLFGKPDKITGSSMNSIYSKNVEDVVSSAFHYNNGPSGTIYINWSDTSYRKPSNKIELFGTGGKMLVDQHSLKIFLNKPDDKLKLRQGWNTIYITEVFQPVHFYVRGNEFTRQLSHFVDCIRGREKISNCSFFDGVSTLNIVDSIFNDYEFNVKKAYEIN